MEFTATGIILAGLVGTLLMTSWMYIAHAFGVERHNPGFYLGTLIFGVCRKAFATGLVVHFCIGIIAAGIYAAIMSALGIRGGVGWGLLFGVVHWLIVMVAYGLVGRWHPAVERGEIQNPGFFALNDGWTQPAMSLIDHLLFGAIVGGTLGAYRVGSEMTVPYSFESFQQPGIAPSIAWFAVVILAVVLFIVGATATTKLGTEDEVFAAAEPRHVGDREWMMKELRQKFEAGDMSIEEYQDRMKELQ